MFSSNFECLPHKVASKMKNLTLTATLYDPVARITMTDLNSQLKELENEVN
jgi:hypothetical protein